MKIVAKIWLHLLVRILKDHNIGIKEHYVVPQSQCPCRSTRSGENRQEMFWARKSHITNISVCWSPIQSDLVCIKRRWWANALSVIGFLGGTSKSSQTQHAPWIWTATLLHDSSELDTIMTWAMPNRLQSQGDEVIPPCTTKVMLKLHSRTRTGACQ